MSASFETDMEMFLRETGVSRETYADYKTWYNLLTHWNKKINLVSPNTISNYWLRHALDSQQLFALAPVAAKGFLDLGSGAGFPGLAMAIALKGLGVGSSECGQLEIEALGALDPRSSRGQSGAKEDKARSVVESVLGQEVRRASTRPKNPQQARVTLVEANGKKCNFLRAVIRDLGLPAMAVQARAENIDAKKYDVITARAFAPLPKLFEYSLPFWSVDKSMPTLAIFPKGRGWKQEVEAAELDWIFSYKTVDSQTEEEAKILIVTHLEKRNQANKDTSLESQTHSSAGEI